MLVLLVFAIVGYLFLRYATIAQVDRALRQQMRVVMATAVTPRDSSMDAAASIASFAQDLKAHGLIATLPQTMPNTIVTSPARVEEDGERRRRRIVRGPTTPNIDWSDLRAKIKMPRDDEDALSVDGPHDGSRVLTEDLKLSSHPILLVASQPLGETVELLETAQAALLIALPVAFLLAIGVGYVLARRALDPVASMTEEAKRIGARNLHERLSVRNPGDELGQLAVTFNDVLQRVDLALEQQRRFTADASHELRTPIALIRAEADVALSSNTAGKDTQEKEYRDALSVIRDGSQQLSRIVNDLFLLARADAGQTLISPRAMQLGDLVSGTVNGMRSLAEKRGLELRLHVQGEAPCQGDEELLRRALLNLLDNAIKYSNGPGTIDVSLEQNPYMWHIVVADNGRGISKEDQPHIFERFFRGDRARGHQESETGAGAGLGLAIAREIAELHGGRVELRQSNESGSVFELILPVQLAG